MLEQQKDDFIAIASHELRTPITSIKTYAELLLDSKKAEQDPMTAGLATKLNGQVDRLSVLVRDLLDVTTIKEGQLKLRQEQFSLNDLVKENSEEQQRVFTSHKIVNELHAIDPVYADKERIGQVLKNLISNAGKYSPMGERIIISTSQQDGRVIVKVQDFGVGIPENMRQKIFERFFRLVESEQSGANSLGLGLYIAANIIRTHGGELWVESNKGAGSTFCFALPIKKPD
jgi:signal transduction histidine kinase